MRWRAWRADGIKGSASGEPVDPAAPTEEIPAWKQQLGNVLAYARLFQCKLVWRSHVAWLGVTRLNYAAAAPFSPLFADICTCVARAGPLIIVNAVIITLELLLGGG
jgi:hypothetical protein